MLTSCATNISGYVVPGENLGRDLVYVLEKDKNDERELYEIVKDQLTKKGLGVYFREELPSGSIPKVNIKYGARWQWDVTWYLLDFNIKFYDLNSSFLIASAQSSRTSLVRKEPTVMVKEALDKLFPEYKTPN
jgi:hypothetical protein